MKEQPSRIRHVRGQTRLRERLSGFGLFDPQIGASVVSEGPRRRGGLEIVGSGPPLFAMSPRKEAHDGVASLAVVWLLVKEGRERGPVRESLPGVRLGALWRLPERSGALVRSGHFTCTPKSHKGGRSTLVGQRQDCANSGRYRTAVADGLKWTCSGFCESHLGRRHPVRPIIHASQIRQVFNQRRRARSTREPHSAARATRLYDAGFTM